LRVLKAIEKRFGANDHDGISGITNSQSELSAFRQQPGHLRGKERKAQAAILTPAGAQHIGELERNSPAAIVVFNTHSQ